MILENDRHNPTLQDVALSYSLSISESVDRKMYSCHIRDVFAHSLSNGFQTRVENNLSDLAEQRLFLNLYSLSYGCIVQICYTNSISRVNDQTNLESLVPQLQTFTARTAHVGVTKSKHPDFIYVTNGKECSIYIFLKNIHFEKK